MARRIVILLIYGCYALLLTGGLLVVLFPRDKVPDWAARRVEEQLPGFACRIDDVRYVHPFTLRFDQVILDNRSTQITVPIDTLSVRFEPGWPLVAQTVSARLFGGVLESNISADWQRQRIELRNLSVGSVNLLAIDFLHRRLDRQIRGTLDLHGEMVVELGRYDTMQFTGTAEINNFATKLRRPVLGLRDIGFSRIGADLRQDKKAIELSAGRFDGELIGGTFSGRVDTEKPWQDSQIEIEIGLIPEPALVENDARAAEIVAVFSTMYEEEVIPCQAAGTLKDPRFSCGGEFESRLERVQ